MTIRRGANIGRYSVGQCLVLKCRRLPPTYRYVAAVCVACVVYTSHLLVQQAFLPPSQTIDAVTHRPSSAGDNATTRRIVDHAVDWTGSHDTGCDVTTRNDFDDADRVVYGTKLSSTGTCSLLLYKHGVYCVVHFHHTFCFINLVHKFASFIHATPVFFLDPSVGLSRFR